MEKEYKFNLDYFLFDDEFIEMLYTKRLCGLPLSFFALDTRKTITHCHKIAAILAYYIEGTKVEGEQLIMPFKDKGHSWVEKGNFVYDATKGSKWIKDSYYEKFQVIKPKEFSEEDIIKEVGYLLGYTDNTTETYIAFIRDLEQRLDSLLYGSFLQKHIERFKLEKDLQNKPYNEEQVNKILKDLHDSYAKTDKFIERSQEEVNKVQLT